MIGTSHDLLQSTLLFLPSRPTLPTTPGHGRKSRNGEGLAQFLISRQKCRQRSGQSLLFRATSNPGKTPAKANVKCEHRRRYRQRQETCSPDLTSLDKTRQRSATAHLPQLCCDVFA